MKNPRPEPHQELLVMHEEEAEGQQKHHLPAQAGGGHQADTDEEYGPPLITQAGLLHAKETADCDWLKRGGG